MNTSSRAVIKCDMNPDRTDVAFDFSLPFEINDDNEILKRLGQGGTAKINMTGGALRSAALANGLRVPLGAALLLVYDQILCVRRYHCW